MEAALVSAATGALKPVLGKLATLLGDEYKRLKGVHGEIKFLSTELAAMHAFLLKMSEEEDPDVQDKVWMTEVRELSYDMEDSIDDFMQRVDDKDAKPDGFMEKIKHSLGKLGKMKTHRRIGKEIQDLKQQIVEVGERNARYKTREAISKTINATVDPRALAIFEHASKLVGIEEPKAEIIKLLTEELGVTSTQQQQQQLKVVSIVGSGGMGKTTLANQVYQELKGKFRCQAFLSVSRNPDMIKILRTILSEVTEKDYTSTEAMDEQQLLSKISDFLVDKSYFIVIDDIWKKEAWDVIKYAFPMTGCGIIITTTRMSDVAHACRSSFSGHIYNIRPLDMVHSRQLFHRRLFDSENDCPSYLEEISNQILEKCAGLPLAIIAICGLLANTERTEHLWKQVKDSIGRELERNPSVELMIKILSLSYFDLPPRLKTCLLYLSIFPEDSIIERKSLIRRWIAEGFIHKEGRRTVHQLGEMCFNELINRSLIQPMKTDRFDKVVSCRVHDIILDFIISKSIEENFVTLVGVSDLTSGTQTKVRRLSHQVEEGGNFVIPTSLVLSHVRSLSVFGQYVGIPSLDQFRHVRVLDFECCSQLENHHLAYIGRLFQLRYLNLRNIGISELPEQIGHLRCLEMLDLRDNNVRELPATIVNLGKLVHLLTDYEVTFPDGISKMQALEMLKRFTVWKQPLNLAQELSQLKNLRKLVLDFEDDSTATEDTAGVKEEREKAIASSLHDLGTHQNLRSLTIVLGGSFLQQGPSCPVPVSLQKLMNWRSDVPRVPNWMSSLFNLQELRLEVMGIGQEDLCILGALPALRILLLGGTTYSGSLTVSGEVGFRSLRQFCYDTKSYGMDLMFAAGSMPKLEKLTIQFHAEQTESLTSGAFDFGIENLPCLVTVNCIAYGHAREAAHAAMERAVNTHPNHPTLLFE